MIDSKAALDAFIANLERSQSYLCAIDTEADSLHRYAESLCLIQFCDGKESVLIDPLAIDDTSSLAAYLKKSTVWMHGADYDMTMLKRSYGELPESVLDTQVAARLLGAERFGLANLIEQNLGLTLCKASQKADWGQRPLSDKMVDYALNDVRYLFPLADLLVAELNEKGRYDWFLQSCNAAREKVLNREEEFAEPWRIQGSGRLGRKGLAYLKALWYWREEEARSWDKPTFMVLSNKIMIDWCDIFEEGNVPNLPNHFRKSRRDNFDAAIEAVVQMATSDYPERLKLRRRKQEDGFEEKVKAWLDRRNKIASELKIDPSLIAPRALIESYVSDPEATIANFLPWQKELLEL